MSLSVEDLLKPRYKVMQLYPFCPYTIGQLIKYSDDGNWFLSVFILYDAEGSRVEKSIYHRIETVDKYPHLFQKLEWWQEREPEDMPEYVKDEKSVYRVIEWHTELAPKCTVFIDPKINSGYVEDCTQSPLYSDMYPATLEEYQSSVKDTTLTNKIK